MKKSKAIHSYLNKQETIGGWIYFIFELLALPTVLQILNAKMGSPLSTAEINFTYFLINFIAVLLIFHDYLGRNLAQVRLHPAYFCQAVILGLVAYYASNLLMGYVISLIDPRFVNANDEAISGMTSSNFFLMAVGTVVLVPPVEECFFRGLIFRELYGKSRWAAYLVSIAAFASVHILGYITVYSPVELILSFLQYLPAGLWLAWAYTKSDTIFAPILIHAAVNAMGIAAMR